MDVVIMQPGVQRRARRGGGALGHRRVRARLRRSRLERELAQGLSLWSSDLHALRARQLAEPSARGEVAAGLRRLVEDAGQPQLVLNAVPLRRTRVLLALCQADVLAWHEGLLGVADRLEGPDPVNPCGVARARILLADASGPLYNPNSARSLGEMIWWIADGLDLSSRPLEARLPYSYT